MGFKSWHFPDRRFDPVLADRFNHEIETMFDETRDIIQAHFYFSPRTDTPFWRANKELKLSDNILEKVEMYKSGLPINQPSTDESTYYGNFEAEFRNFWTNGSYYCIFTGMGSNPTDRCRCCATGRNPLRRPVRCSPRSRASSSTGDDTAHQLPVPARVARPGQGRQTRHRSLSSLRSRWHVSTVAREDADIGRR